MTKDVIESAKPEQRKRHAKQAIKAEATLNIVSQAKTPKAKTPKMSVEVSETAEPKKRGRKNIDSKKY